MYAPVIGIDFGTTKTLVAYSTGEGDKPEIAHLGRERNSLPTSAFIGESGIWEFGDDADDYACDPALADRYSSGFKLKLGSTTPTLQVFGTQGFQAFSSQRISALFFAHVREKCTKEVFNGRAVSRAVITHPVKFSPAQLHDLRNAAEQAGFSDITLMREPEAAGLAFCRLCPQDLFSGTALIVDWGGGTLDLALVSRKTDSVQIHNNYVAGHNHIGGNEFDELLWKYVNARLQHEKGVKLSEDSVDFQRLQKKKIRAAKEKLSRTDSAMLGLSGKQGAYPPLKLTREELETVLKPAVQTGVDLICNLLNSIQEGSLKPSQILLIGGSSQIPLISRLIEESSKIPCRRWQYSHEAVALGAAIGKERPHANATSNNNKTPQRSAPDSNKHLIDLYLTDNERRNGTRKHISFHNENLGINIPGGVNVGSHLKLSASSTGLQEDILVTIRQAPTVTIRLSEEEFRTGGPKTIHVEGKNYEVILPKNTHPDQTCDFNLEDIGSVIVHLLPNQPKQTTKEPHTISLSLTEEERREGAMKHILVNNELVPVRIQKGLTVGKKLRLSSTSTGYSEDIFIVIEEAPTINVILSEHEFALGGEKRISYKGNTLTIEIPHNVRPDETWIFDFEGTGSIYVHFISQNRTSSNDAKLAHKLLKEAKEHFERYDYEAAFNLYLKSAQLGNTEAQYKVACRYAYGQGVPTNISEALTWSLLSARGGNKDAESLYLRLNPTADRDAIFAHVRTDDPDNPNNPNLSASFLLHKGDKLFFSGAYSAAVGWYKKAAEKGNAEAMWKLAIRYRDGIGAPQSLQNARYWCTKAVQAGHEHARHTLKEIS